MIGKIVQRREFGKQAVSCIACAPFLDSSIDQSRKQVVIIGAGISGLCAATELRSKGIDVLVLEARSKLGGRLRTDRSLGVPFDEGASWIHGPKGNPITEVSKSAGVTTFRTDDESVEVYDVDGTQYTDRMLESEERRYRRCLRDLRGHVSRSFEDALNEQFPFSKNNRLWTIHAFRLSGVRHRGRHSRPVIT